MLHLQSLESKNDKYLVQGKIMDIKYGAVTKNEKGDIVSPHGCELNVKDLTDENSDYFVASVNGVEGDGLTQNEAVLNAFNRSQADNN
jgi:hypothetical protein